MGVVNYYRVLCLSHYVDGFMKITFRLFLLAAACFPEHNLMAVHPHMNNAIFAHPKNTF